MFILCDVGKIFTVLRPTHMRLHDNKEQFLIKRFLAIKKQIKKLNLQRENTNYLHEKVKLKQKIQFLE